MLRKSFVLKSWCSIRLKKECVDSPKARESRALDPVQYIGPESLQALNGIINPHFLEFPIDLGGAE